MLAFDIMVAKSCTLQALVILKTQVVIDLELSLLFKKLHL